MNPAFFIRAVIALSFLLFISSTHAESSEQNIGVFGDSLGDGVWSGLYVVLKKHPEDKLFRYAKVGSGLTRNDYGNWFSEMTAALDADHITSAVIMFGANDLQSIRDDDHKGYLFQSEGWKRVYTHRVNSILAELSKRKIKIIWIGLPILRKDELNKGGEYLDTIFSDAAKRGGATFIPLIDTFKGSDGGFAAQLPDATGRLRQIRADDGVHFTAYGYQMIAEKAYAAIIAGTPSEPAGKTAP